MTTKKTCLLITVLVALLVSHVCLCFVGYVHGRIHALGLEGREDASTALGIIRTFEKGQTNAAFQLARELMFDGVIRAHHFRNSCLSRAVARDHIDEELKEVAEYVQTHPTNQEVITSIEGEALQILMLYGLNTNVPPE